MDNNNFLVTRVSKKLSLKPQKTLHFGDIKKQLRNKIYLAAINFSKHFRLDLNSVSSNQIIDFFFEGIIAQVNILRCITTFILDRIRK